MFYVCQDDNKLFYHSACYYKEKNLFILILVSKYRFGNKIKRICDFQITLDKNKYTHNYLNNKKIGHLARISLREMTSAMKML